MVSVPLKSAAGVYVIVPSALMVTLPDVADAEMTVSASPSTSVSLSRTGMTTGVSSGVLAVSFAATGTGLATVQVKLVETVPPFPSSAVMVTV